MTADPADQLQAAANLLARGDLVLEAEWGLHRGLRRFPALRGKAPLGIRRLYTRGNGVTVYVRRKGDAAADAMVEIAVFRAEDAQREEALCFFGSVAGIVCGFDASGAVFADDPDYFEPSPGRVADDVDVWFHRVVHALALRRDPRYWRRGNGTATGTRQTTEELIAKSKAAATSTTTLP